MLKARVIVAGVLFGLVQVGFFLALELHLSSAFLTFLVVTGAWLAGTIAGLRLAPKGGRDHVWLLASAAAYFATWAVLVRWPFRDSLLVLHAVLIMISASYAGRFFVWAGERVKPASRLFFLENNGFVLGLAMGPLAYLGAGRVALLVLPAVCVLLVGGLGWFGVRESISARDPA